MAAATVETNSSGLLADPSKLLSDLTELRTRRVPAYHDELQAYVVTDYDDIVQILDNPEVALIPLNSTRTAPFHCRSP